MFLRKKIVGRFEYFQIVESIRNKKGPRLKVHASLGRTDKMENSGVLDSFAESVAKYSQNGLFLSNTSSLKLRTMPRKIMHKLVIRQLLIHAEREQINRRSMGQTEFPANFRKILRQTLFGANTLVNLDFLVSMGNRAELPKNVRDLFYHSATENDSLIVHIDRPCKQSGPLSLMKGLITATTINSKGQVILVEHWQNILPLPSMIEKHVGRLLEKVPHKRLIIVMDRTLVSKRLIGFFSSKNVQFIMPLYESNRTLTKMPDEIVEKHLNPNPFDDSGAFRYIRAINYCTASYERAIRETQLLRLKTTKTINLRQSREIKRVAKNLEEMADRDGNSIFVSNMRDSLDDILQYYLLGQKSGKFQAKVNEFCAKISLHLDMPRDTKDIIDGVINLQLLASHLTKPLLDKVSNVAGKRVSWSQIVNVIDNNCPITIKDGDVELVFVPTDPQILQTIFAALEIDVEMISRANITAGGLRCTENNSTTHGE